MSDVTKSELRFLEKIFAKEIEGGMLKSKSKIAQRLKDDGYIQEVERIFKGPLGSVVCKGFVLTIKGNATYCMSDLCLEETP